MPMVFLDGAISGTKKIPHPLRLLVGRSGVVEIFTALVSRFLLTFYTL